MSPDCAYSAVAKIIDDVLLMFTLFCSSEYPWSLWIWTSDLPGAGTDASIILQIYGEMGKSDEMKLDNKTDNFEQGQLDKFMVISVFGVKILCFVLYPN